MSALAVFPSPGRADNRGWNHWPCLCCIDFRPPQTCISGLPRRVPPGCRLRWDFRAPESASHICCNHSALLQGLRDFSGGLQLSDIDMREGVQRLSSLVARRAGDLCTRDSSSNKGYSCGVPRLNNFMSIVCGRSGLVPPSLGCGGAMSETNEKH